MSSNNPSTSARLHNSRDLAEGVLTGNRRALAQAITLVESQHPDDQPRVRALLSRLGPRRDNSLRIGVTGIPGVGKSTFIEALGSHLVEQHNKRLAVLTVDPSSRRTGGSILGDKTRMGNLAVHPQVYIRPSPSGLALGGVTYTTHEVINVVEAAGFDVIIVETVGVGQSEVSVVDMTDIFLLLLAPAAGDELQGIKRGIVELADVLIVNKSDGDLLAAAQRTAADYSSALRLMRGADKAADSIALVSALHASGIDTLWQNLQKFEQVQRASGDFAVRRASQSVSRLWQEISAQLLAAMRTNNAVASSLSALESQVKAGDLSVTVAAAELIQQFQRST